MAPRPQRDVVDGLGVDGVAGDEPLEELDDSDDDPEAEPFDAPDAWPEDDSEGVFFLSDDDVFFSDAVAAARESVR